MKYVPFLTLVLMIALPVYAQDVPPEEAPPVDAPEGAEPDVDPAAAPEGVAEPEPEGVAEPEPEVSEPEPEVSEPEPEVSEPEPEVSEPEPEVSDSAGGLGTAAPEETAPVETTVSEDVAEATTEGGEAAEAAGEGEEGEGGTLSAAERLASVTGGQGVNWTFPFVWGNNMSVDTLRPTHRPTYNPLYSMGFSIAPRYIFTPVVSIGARMRLDIEMTDSNLTPEGRDLEWGDLQVDTTFALPWRPGGVTLAPAIALRVPTSQLSRGQSRVLGPTARINFLKAFGVLDGLIMGGGIGYTFWIHSSGSRRFVEGSAGVDNTGTDVAGNPLTVRDANSLNCPQGSFAADATSFGTGSCNGGNQIRHQPSISAFVALIPVSGLTVSMSFAAFWLVNRGHDTTYVSTDQVVTADGQALGVGDNSPTHSTTVTSFAASVGYDWTPWITTTLGYSTLSFFPDSDGTLENFIYNEFSQFNLSVSFRPSALVTSLRAEEEEEAEAMNEATRVAF